MSPVKDSQTLQTNKVYAQMDEKERNESDSCLKSEKSHFFSSDGTVASTGSSVQNKTLTSYQNVLHSLSQSDECENSDMNLSSYQTMATIDSILLDQYKSSCKRHHELHHAITCKDYLRLALLLKSRSREYINQLDVLGRTPLHLALLGADVISTQLLLGYPFIISMDSLDSPTDGSRSSETPSLDPFKYNSCLDLDFPDLSLRFGGLSVFHLPLASAVCNSHETTLFHNIINCYKLLCGYTLVAQHLLHNEQDSSSWNSECDEFLEACGWNFSVQENGDKGNVENLQHFIHKIFLASDVFEKESFWSLNAIDEEGATALHLMCSLGLKNIVEFFLRAGANPLIKDKNGFLPLHRAMDSYNEQLFLLVLQKSLDAMEQVSCDDSFNDVKHDLCLIGLLKSCILRGSWTCLGALMLKSQYAPINVSDSTMDMLVKYSTMCGFEKEFTQVFSNALQGHIETFNGSNLRGTVPLTIFTHDSCFHHIPLQGNGDLTSTQRLSTFFKYPENPSRLHCLVNDKGGILKSQPFSGVSWCYNPKPAGFVDILRVHDWSYISTLVNAFTDAEGTKTNELLKISSVENDKDNEGNTEFKIIKKLDADTIMTLGSWEAACGAAGCGLAAVDAVCSGATRSAFCAIRPPGHHVGTFGPCQPPNFNTLHDHLISCENEEDWLHGSQGFCLLNNVAIAAAYARFKYSEQGIRRIAIVDFDIHHGNGTQQIVLNLRPRVRNLMFHPYQNASGLQLDVHYKTEFWKPWLDETDTDNVFFVSIHGFGERFYPNTGGVEFRYQYPTLRNVCLPPYVTREEYREAFSERLIRPLVAFHPDLILISAGFDSHAQDLVNDLFASCSKWDFEWITRLLVAVANDCCDGRIVSLLEGGYNTKAGALSPLAQSVAHHVHALIRTSASLSLAAAIHLEYPFIKGSDALVAPKTIKKRKRAAALRALASLNAFHKEETPIKQECEEECTHA